MTLEDKKLLLRDLCSRLPYELKVQYKENTYDLLGLDKGRVFVNIARIGEWLSTVYTFDIKPYLRSMSSMTEEEKIEFRTLRFNERIGKEFGLSQDYLNSIHIDYRGMIPMGLALEAPEDMYK